MSPAYSLFRNFLIFTLALASLSCSRTQPPPEGFSLQGFQSFIGANYPVTFVKQPGEQGTEMIIEYPFKKTREIQRYIIVIQFFAPSTLVDEADYLAQYQASASANNPRMHAMRFPTIGHYAQYNFLGAGPDGASEELIFTSSNRHYDVRISRNHLLPNTVDAPELDLESLARYIDKTLTNIEYIKD